jgi:hypothetical protein
MSRAVVQLRGPVEERGKSEEWKSWKEFSYTVNKTSPYINSYNNAG